MVNAKSSQEELFVDMGVEGWIASLIPTDRSVCTGEAAQAEKRNTKWQPFFMNTTLIRMP
jgi:hypothetical protein